MSTPTDAITPPTEVWADWFPALPRPWPVNVQHTKVRAVVGDTCVTYLWADPRDRLGAPVRLDVPQPSPPQPTEDGRGFMLADGTQITRAGGCACGSAKVKRAQVW